MKESNFPPPPTPSYFSFTESPYYNILLIALAFACELTTSTIMTTTTPVFAHDNGAMDAVAALTVGLKVIGSALSSAPSGWLFMKYGRYYGFSFGILLQLIGTGIGCLASIQSSVSLLLVSCLFIGLGQGIGQFFRFFAVEITPDRLKNRAVTYVISGGVLAALIGPTVANFSRTIFSIEYLGCFVSIGIVLIIEQVFINLVDYNPSSRNTSLVSSRLSEPFILEAGSVQITPETIKKTEKSLEIPTLYEMIKDLKFIESCLVATLANSIMVILMANVSVSMSMNDFSFHHIAQVLQLHFIAMYFFGFLTGPLLESYGPFRIALVGALVFASSAVVLLLGQNFWNYALGMSLVGIAWNISFSAGTIMLTVCYEAEHATAYEGWHDFFLFLITGILSFVSGFVFTAFGWNNLIYSVAILMGLYILTFFLFPSNRDEIEIYEDFPIETSFNPDLTETKLKEFENLQSNSSEFENYMSIDSTKLNKSSFIEDRFSVLNPVHLRTECLSADHAIDRSSAASERQSRYSFGDYTTAIRNMGRALANEGLVSSNSENTRGRYVSSNRQKVRILT